jgi:hypothetical protein
MRYLKIGISLFSAFFLIYQYCYCQIISEKVFDSIGSRGRIIYYDAHDKCFGCCNAIECMGFNLLFYKIIFDRYDSSLVLQGRTYIAISQTGKDTLALGKVQIFDAVPLNNKLIKTRKVTVTYYRKSGNYINPNTFPFRMGEFYLKIKIVKNRRLYFMRSGFMLIEYDLNKLFDYVPLAK